MTGSSRFLGRARADCSSATATFSATLAHRAKPNGTCEALSIELVIRRACGGPGPVQGYTSRAINVDCAVAASVARQWSRQRDCGRRSCTVAGWRCGRPTGTPRTTHCLSAHAAVEIERQIIIED